MQQLISMKDKTLSHHKSYRTFSYTINVEEIMVHLVDFNNVTNDTMMMLC